MSKLRKKNSISILVLACLALAGCDDHTKSEVEVRPVRVVAAHSVVWSDFPSQVGEIHSHTESDLGFKIGGRVLSRLVDLGAVVHKGEVLARLNDQDQRNQLAAAQADLTAARASLVQTEAEERRQAELLAHGWATRSRYDAALMSRDSARASVNAAEAKLRLAQDQLSYSELLASDDGAISAIGAEVGQVVNAGQMVVRLADLKKKDAVFTISENGVLQLPQAQSAEVEVRLLDAPGIMATGQISEVSPSADPVTHTYTVKVALSSPPDVMRLGMSVVGRVKTNTQQVMPLPASALFEKDGQPAVWVVDSRTDTVTLTPVKLAREDNNRILIASGLPEGALVVTAGVQRLWPGLKVRVLDENSRSRETP